MNTALLLIILIPIVEIYLFIKIGSQIGAFTTISLIFITAVIGVYYARYEGLNTLKSGVSQLYRNQMPLFELMSGAALAVAAVLLILPGFATDIIGILLILGACRRASEGIQAAKDSNWKWSADYLIGKQLTGSRLGILGMGRIGQKIAKIAKSNSILSTPKS